MDKYMVSPAMRFFFSFSSCVMLLGVWLTGFSVVSSVLYFPLALFGFAALTGICPGLILARIAFPEKK